MNFRIVLLLLAGIAFTSCSPTPKIDEKKLEALYRSAKSIEGALTVGITYDKFGQLLQNLATEVSIAGDKIKTEQEKQLVNVYTEALTIFQDSLLVWRHQIQSSRENLVPSNWILVLSELRPIVAKYNLRKERFSTGLEAIPPDSLQLIWAAGTKKLREASALLRQE